ncbi:rifin PIR protein,putative [Plasmodium sp. DRC-Itaito]|nr:rifin PIR protein,putative [Plasmodium sp. DRC-Itaito]
MKVHYINILLFAHVLNILVNTHKKTSITPHHTKTKRSLCECELYAPANYDNDPQMKKVMDNFNKQTQQRFHEYDERMKTTRQKCKDRCDKEIQKIILKDKLEKQMAEHFATLDTDIQSDAIPTCVCEKSIADKVEKGCLRCGGILGTAVPEFGLIGGSLLNALNTWKPYALFAATKYALAKGVAKGAVAGKAAGMDAINVVLKQRGIARYCPEIFDSIQKIGNFTELKDFIGPIIDKHKLICGSSAINNGGECAAFDTMLEAGGSSLRHLPPPNTVIKSLLGGLAEKGKTTADFKAADVTYATYTKIMTKQTALIEGGFDSSITSIYASIIAIVVVVLIMVIIYLILRYRRKKKMKKKLQYIKLLEE